MNNLIQYILGIADNALILGQRLGELCGHGPSLETDIAMTNISLDLLGQTRSYYQYVAKMQGGESEMEYDEENQQFVIKARAICFPMLVHEIVKGLYEIVGTEGFGSDKEKNQSIINAVDKVSNEPEDLRYGKFIYDAINEIKDAMEGMLSAEVKEQIIGTAEIRETFKIFILK